MPRISEFYGIVIEMYWSDHNPPHFHAKYAEHRAEIDIRTLVIFEGWLPAKARSLVSEWLPCTRSNCLLNGSGRAIMNRSKRSSRCNSIGNQHA